MRTVLIVLLMLGFFTLETPVSRSQANGSVTVFFGAFDPPGIPFSASNDQKTQASVVPINIISLDDYPVGYEVVRVGVDWSGSALASDTTVTMTWHKAGRSGPSQVFQYQYTWSQGCTHAYAYSWIGHKTFGEIDGPLRGRMPSAHQVTRST
jgi:hypothetical protein